MLRRIENRIYDLKKEVEAKIKMSSGLRHESNSCLHRIAIVSIKSSNSLLVCYYGYQMVFICYKHGHVDWVIDFAYMPACVCMHEGVPVFATS